MKKLFMRMLLAYKAFIKAFKQPEEAMKFLEGKKEIPQKKDFSHLRLLSLLQQSGRLIDFIQEDISAFNDAQVGAAVRKIHEECRKSLEELVTIRPVMEEREGETVRIESGYDASAIKVIGKVKGEPPFTGKLVHKGWKAHKHSLPKQVGTQLSEVIQPAEVEIQ